MALLSLSCAAAPAQAPPATATPGWPVITPAPLPTAEMAYPDPELGDCFGGVFSRVDAMQCYMLERAQSAGVIDIEKIYKDGGVLRISLNQNGPVDGQVYLFLRERTVEFLVRWPHLVPDNSDIWCTDDIGGPVWNASGCILLFVEFLRTVPPTADYYAIVFHVGGESARREIPGWAGWRQLWPAVASGASGAGGDAGPFDVSDVDVTNFPECGEPDVPKCPLSPSYSVVGRHYSDRSGTVYYQVKNPPTDEEELQALKDRLIPCNTLDPCTYTRRYESGRSVEVDSTRRRVTPIVIIPVEYSLLELWRWAEILDRFALSAGNTIGITGARVETNRGVLYDATVWFIEEAGSRTGSVRETIAVWGRDAQRVADALPVLLPQLGIPVDAVGLVATSG